MRVKNRSDRPPPPTSKRDVGKRWTAELVKDGWTPVSDDFLELYADLPNPITTAEAMLLIHLIHFKWDEKAPFPGFKTIAKRMGLTDTQVRNHARSLDRKGYLQRIKRVGTTNRFHLEPLFKALERQKEIKLKEQEGQYTA